MRLVAQRPASLSKRTNWISERWWDNFVHHTIEANEFIVRYPPGDEMSFLKEALKKYNVSLIKTYFGIVLDFDSDAAATAFVLRWS